MKKFRKLIPAFAMLLISAIMLSTASYAWFSMNTTVTATGMEIQAKSEGGLLISATTAADSWSNNAAIILGKTVQLLPASTSTGTSWYHAHSKDSDTAVSFADGDGYYLLADGTSADVAPSNATLAGAGTLYTAEENLFSNGSAKIIYDENGSNTTYDAGVDNGFYLVSEYYIRSSANEITVGDTETYKAFAINKIDIQTINGSANLDKCLRMAVVIYNNTTAVSDFVVLAPVNGADGVTATSGTKSQTTAATSDVTALVGLCSSSITTYYANVDLGLTAAIPSNTSNNYLTAKIYVWFEGEDSTCISDNLTSALDSLSIAVSFKLVTITGQYNDIATLTEPTA